MWLIDFRKECRKTAERFIMVKVVGVRFRTAGKIYFFDPLQFEIKRGEKVIVETARGIEFGTVVSDVREVEEASVVQPLKPILRIANQRDKDQEAGNKEKEKEAFKICQEKIRKHGLEMKLIDAEYTFDNNKVLFYFTADGRIDFRELVKDLAGVFKTRIELRQIGVRDETKIMGGIGICGRPLCCHSYLSDFIAVSIKMAKEQNLSLNPAKISGVCGRLMCCLKNEEETYEELNRKLPGVGDYVTTADGQRGEVQSVNVLRQLVKVLVENGDDKELKEFEADQLKFHKHHGKKGQQNMSAEELKELEQLEKEETEDEKAAEASGEKENRQGGKGEKRPRQDKGNFKDRGDRQEKNERQGGRSDRQDRSERLERQERTERQEKSDRQEGNRQDRNDRQGRNHRQDRDRQGDRQDRTDRQDRGNRQDNNRQDGDRPERNNRQDGNRQENNRQDGNRQENNRQDNIRQDRNDRTDRGENQGGTGKSRQDKWDRNRGNHGRQDRKPREEQGDRQGKERQNRDRNRNRQENPKGKENAAGRSETSNGGNDQSERK